MRDVFCFFLRLVSFWVSLAVILTHSDDARADIADQITGGGLPIKPDKCHGADKSFVRAMI